MLQIGFTLPEQKQWRDNLANEGGVVEERVSLRTNIVVANATAVEATHLHSSHPAVWEAWERGIPVVPICFIKKWIKSHQYPDPTLYLCWSMTPGGPQGSPSPSPMHTFRKFF